MKEQKQILLEEYLNKAIEFIGTPCVMLMGVEKSGKIKLMGIGSNIQNLSLIAAERPEQPPASYMG